MRSHTHTHIHTHTQTHTHTHTHTHTLLCLFIFSARLRVWANAAAVYSPEKFYRESERGREKFFRLAGWLLSRKSTINARRLRAAASEQRCGQNSTPFHRSNNFLGRSLSSLLFSRSRVYSRGRFRGDTSLFAFAAVTR